MRYLRTTLLLTSAAFLAACSDTGPMQGGEDLQTTLAPVYYATGGAGIEGRFIVVMKAGDDAGRLAEGIGARPRHVYGASFNGFAAELTPGQLNRLRANPNVDYIEQDQMMSLGATQSGATWGIDRIDQRNRPLSGTYTYTSTASSVNAYIVDSGINAGHSQFGGRAQSVYDATGGNGVDCNGHGTHVAGTVGGSSYGVAKAVRIRSVRVGQCGSGLSNSAILAGINWVRTNHVKPAVANLSLGGGYSSTLNSAVQNLINAGVFVAVAAGNSAIDACNASPASLPAATTVAASTSTDARASYSNYGTCVDLYAPGSSITSSYIGSTSATGSLSGTSMAAPHVTGVAALYKATYGDASQATIDAWLKNNATANVITSNPSGTPNRLLFKAGL